MAGHAAVEFEHVSFTYHGADAPAIEDVTLRVEPGERLGVLGPNGGGKSTLIKIALGLLRGYSGRVLVHGEPPERARRAGIIGYVPQRCEAALMFPLSVRQVVEMGAVGRQKPWRTTSGEVRARVQRCIELVGAGGFAHKPIGEISGGQLQRAMIARALAASPKILALDEPTVGIDAVGQRGFADLLQTLHQELELSILIVTHDVRVVAAGCDRVACMARTLHFHDDPGGLTPQVLAEVFRHDVSSVFGDLHIDAHAADDCPGDHMHAPAGFDAPAADAGEHERRG